MHLELNQIDLDAAAPLFPEPLSTWIRTGVIRFAAGSILVNYKRVFKAKILVSVGRCGGVFGGGYGDVLVEVAHASILGIDWFGAVTPKVRSILLQKLNQYMPAAKPIKNGDCIQLSLPNFTVQGLFILAGTLHMNLTTQQKAEHPLDKSALSRT